MLLERVMKEEEIEDAKRRSRQRMTQAPHKFLAISASSPKTLTTTTKSSSLTVRFALGHHYMDSYLLHRSLSDDGQEGASKRWQARGRRRSKETFPSDDGS